MKKMKKKRIMLAILPRFPTKWTTVSKKDLMIRERKLSVILFSL